MKTRIYLREADKISVLAEVDLEVVPRGFYVVDGVMYQYVGQPTFHIYARPAHTMEGEIGIPITHRLSGVDLIVEKV